MDSCSELTRLLCDFFWVSITFSTNLWITFSIITLQDVIIIGFDIIQYY